MVGGAKQAEFPQQRLCTVAEVAEFLSLSRSKVYNLMDSGLLRYVKLGKSRRIQWADVLNLVDRSTIGSAEV